MSHKKFGPDRFSRFDVYWIQTDRQTNKQTDRQAKFICILYCSDLYLVYLFNYKLGDRLDSVSRFMNLKYFFRKFSFKL